MTMLLERASDEQVVAFFRALYRNSDPDQGGTLEIRGISPARVEGRSVSAWFPLDQSTGAYRSAVKYAREINAAGYDAFFGVNPRVNRGQEDNDCLAGVALWVDVDGLADRGAAEAKLEKVLEHPLAADLAVFTGGGIHVYWILKEPRDPAEDDFPIYLRSLRAMATTFGGDPKVCNLSRVLRVPGCISHKRNCETLLWMRE